MLDQESFESRWSLLCAERDRRKVNLFCIAARSLSIRSSFAMAHQEALAKMTNRPIDSLDALLEGSRKSVECVMRRPWLRKSEANLYRISINFNELSVSNGSLERFSTWDESTSRHIGCFTRRISRSDFVCGAPTVMEEKVNLVSTAARSVLMSSASVMAHWRAVSYEFNRHRDVSDALPEGSRDPILHVVRRRR